jgi:hypothetical protein
MWLVKLRKVMWPGSRKTKFSKRLTETCSTFVVAVGDCGSCTSWAVHDSLKLLQAGLQGVLIVTEAFLPIAAATAASLGCSSLLPILVLPHPLVGRPEDQVEELASVVVRDYVTKTGAEIFGRLGGIGTQKAGSTRPSTGST